jgi:predicted small metal-binding protein
VDSFGLSASYLWAAVITLRGDFLPSFKCRDIGMDCPFEASAATEEELMKKITQHARTAHNMKPPYSEDMMNKIKKAIKK